MQGTPESSPSTFSSLKHAVWRKKSVHELQAEASADQAMHRALGPVGLVALGIGAVIGAGIFVLTGQAAASYAGPAITFSFVLAAVACALTGLCYAEFAAMIPISGSAYTYAYATLGEFLAWFIGWDLVLEYAMAAGTVAVGWSGYFASLARSFGIHLPPQITAAPGTDMVYLTQDVIGRIHSRMPEGWYELANFAKPLETAGVTLADLQHATALFNVPGAAIIVLLSLLLMRGIRESAAFNAFIVSIKLVVIALFIGFGVLYINADNLTPFIPENTGTFGEFGWSGIARAAGVIFFAYIGFDAVSTAAQEAKNPQRDMPIGILGSLAICTILYVAVALVLTGVVHYTNLKVADPIAVAVDAMGIPWLAVLVKLGAIAGLTSVILVSLLGQSRVFYTMSKDGLLPSAFARIHPRLRTPARSTAITGSVVAMVAGLAPIDILGELVSIGTLSAFIIVCGGVWMLRRRHPELPRPFRTPWVPLVPILGIAFCLYLMAGLPIDTWARLLVWLLIGFAIYFSYGIRKSSLAARKT